MTDRGADEMRKLLRIIGSVSALTSFGLVMTVSEGSSATAAAEANKLPVKLGQIVTFMSPAFEFTSAKAAFDASVKDINAHGGLNGHPIDPITCDDQGQASVAAECARQLIDQDHVVAIGGGVSGYTSPFSRPRKLRRSQPSALSRSRAPRTSRSSTPVRPTIGYDRPILFKSDWKTVAYLNYQGFPPSAPLVEKGQKAAGTHVSLKIVTVPLTTTDFTPIAAEVKSLGADAVLFTICRIR